MTRDPNYDDAAIGKLIRNVAEDWTVPAVRLDAPGWRERVRSARSRRVGAVRGWLARAGQAATAAVALTVVAAMVAVVLTRTPSGPGTSPGPSDNVTPGSSGAALPSLLPKLFVDGEVPDPTSVIVMLERGNFARVDLAKGAIGSAMTSGSYGSSMTVLADGAMVCLCVVESGIAGTMPTEAKVSVIRFDAAGERLSDTPVETFVGSADPRDTGTYILEQPPHVLTSMSFSADGRYGFVGWSKRVPPAWQSGVVVVDLDDGSVASRLALPDEGTGEGTARRVTAAPAVVGTTSVRRILIARSWYGWHPVTSANPTYDSGSDTFAASFTGGELTGAAPLRDAADCGDVVVGGGQTPAGGTWLACQGGGSSVTVVRRLAGDGAKVDDIELRGRPGIEGNLTAASPDGAYVFGWDPVTATLTRVELATGETDTGQAPAAGATVKSPLSALGSWLAPTVAAKSWLRGGIVISPDGTRVYALGIDEPRLEHEPGGSKGIYAFDADTLESVGTWSPTADFVSLAMSANGRFVYAAGLPGLDSGGRPLATQASITVFDATDGTLRLVAGALGWEPIVFSATVFD